MRYLEQQLRARTLAGKAVALAGISAGMIFLSGCSGTSAGNHPADIQSSAPIEQTEAPDTITEEGEAPAIEDNNVYEVTGKAEVIIPGKLPTNSRNKIFTATEEMPQFPGGDEEEARYIREHFIYPEEALKKGIQGRVIVQFYVDTLGNACEPKIIRGIEPSIDREISRVIRTLPKYKPGRMNGKNVNVWRTLPITIKLPPNRQ